MARRSSGARRTGADMFGNQHGQNGKGDRDRTTDRERYRERLSEVKLPGDVQMTYVGGGRYRKVYA